MTSNNSQDIANGLSQLSLTDNPSVQKLVDRQNAILERITALERLFGVTPPPPTASTTPSNGLDISSPVQKRLEAELIQNAFKEYRFVRAPPEYYDSPLTFRQQVVSAASTAHLCKSIIMENTRITEEQAKEEGLRKYFLVIVQYEAKLHSDKLRNTVHTLHDGKLAKSKINMRLCPEHVSDTLSGFEHNAVSPIGMKTLLPMIMSHKIAVLQPDFFWLGAGEVDLKVGVHASEFVEKYHPHVVDCTYDGNGE